MLLKFKPGVEVKLLDTLLLRGLVALAEMFERAGVPELTITSVNDGTHKVGSFHYTGLAVDIRSKVIDPAVVERVRKHFLDLYDFDFDLIWESRGLVNEHLHLEYDPRSS